MRRAVINRQTTETQIALSLPKLELVRSEVRALGPDTWRIRLAVANSGYLPSRDYWLLGTIFGAIFLIVFLAIGVPWAGVLSGSNGH